MGAMAPPPHWTPKDDVLLKNAVEAGASLESLAKGAVQFSRRYSVQELQDRWSKLLYDPVISNEASTHMIEIERSTLTNQPRTKCDFVKELSGSSGKRKTESIRKYYYAMRKRICNEPCNMVGANLLSDPSHSILGDSNALQSADCGIGNALSHDLGIQGPDFDLDHPSISGFGQPVSESVPPFSTGQSMSRDLSFPFEENLSPVGDCGDVLGFDHSKHLPLSNVFGTEGIENREHPCLDFGDSSFHSFGCSSSLPQMPVWSTSPDMPMTNLPIHSGENDQQAGEMFLMPPVGGVNEMEAIKCDGAGPSSSFQTPLGISQEDYFAELSNTLFDFSNEDELLFMDSGKESIDKSYLEGLSSLLLDSPNRVELSDANQDEVVGAADRHFVQTCGVPDNRELCFDYGPKIPDPSEASPLPPVKVGPEYRNGVICCVLNTEDTEIPSNDDVFLPFRCSSPSPPGMTWRMQDPSHLISSLPTGLSGTRKSNVVQNKQKGSNRSCVLESSQPSNVVSKGKLADQGVKFELPKSSIHASVRDSRNREFSSHISSANAAANKAIDGGIRGIERDMDRGKGLSYKPGGSAYLDKCNPSPDSLQPLPKDASSSRVEIDARPEIPRDGSSNLDVTSQNAVVEDPIELSSSPDQDKQWSENDFDVPNFSDVEAMILDMDLSPDEFDIYTNPEVQRFQHEETKRTIMRLEQAANASTRRLLASRGAFAALSDRHSKYFIKKHEVLLGRATEDIPVDIDLGRERNGGKISRRQATVKLDTAGKFHLRNLGKCSIYVNGKEVACGQTASLTSGCLVQIRGLAYLFETNENLLKWYVESTAHTVSSGDNLCI